MGCRVQYPGYGQVSSRGALAPLRHAYRAPDVTVLVKRVRRMATHSLVEALDHATGYQGQGGRWRSSLHLPTTIPAPGPFLLRTARHFEPRASLADALAQTYGVLGDDGGPGWDAGVSFDKRMRTGMRATHEHEHRRPRDDLAMRLLSFYCAFTLPPPPI